MADHTRELKTRMFKHAATRVRRNGGFIRTKELINTLQSFAWHDAVGRKLSSPERARLASDVVTGLKATFRREKYRRVPKVSSSERKIRDTEIAAFLLENKTAGTPVSYGATANFFGVSKSTIARIGKQNSETGGRPFLERLLSIVLPREGRLVALESTLLRRLELEAPGKALRLADEIEKLRDSNSPLSLTPIERLDETYGRMFVVSRGRNWPVSEQQRWGNQVNERRTKQRANYRLPQLRFVAPYLFASVSPSSTVRLVCSLSTVLADVEELNAWLKYFELVRAHLGIPTADYDFREMAKILSGAFRQGDAEGLQSVSRFNQYFLSESTKSIHKVGVEILQELSDCEGKSVGNIDKT